MTDPKRHDVAQWLHKSQHDLGSAAIGKPTMADARNAFSLARDIVVDVTHVIGGAGS